ncbi:MAG: DegT/DnrJ/EryC1/StrS family aminotransferase [Pseudomonadota bacterium]
MSEVFTGVFTQQEPLPEAAISAAVAVMKSGRLHRYNTVADQQSETDLLEVEFARSVDAKYCLSVASGGYALSCALRAIGVGNGDLVLTNAFTLAPVPGSIAAVGAVPVFVETTEDLVIDLDDLRLKAEQTGSKVLMLSHMRGHIVDMDAIQVLCCDLGITMIEDCAHTMGASWKGKPSGRFGLIGCYSTQTYKHINSGEGGFLVTDKAEVMARAVMLSGSYMFYGKHSAGPEPELYKDISLDTPNNSGRMDNLRAAILRPQLANLRAQAEAWNARYRILEGALRDVDGVHLPYRPQAEGYVASSFQFRLPDWSDTSILDFMDRCLKRGVELKWFGRDEPVGYTSRHDSWRYLERQQMPQTDAVLSTLLDMRIPLTFSLEDCELIGRILKEEVAAG